MTLKYLGLGFFVKIVTGFDDTITNAPILANVTKTRIGRIAFSVGTLLAIGVAILLSVFLISAIMHLEYYRYISAGLIFAIAAAIHFDLFVHKPKEKTEKKVKKVKFSHLRFLKLVGIGFVASIATVIDDVVAYSPLMFSNLSRVYAIIGIFAATILEIIVVIYFAKKIEEIKYKEEIAVIGLVILGTLVLAGIV